MIDEDALAAAVDEALRRGAGQAEAYATWSRFLEVRAHGGRADRVRLAAEGGVALRVFHGDRAGCAYAPLPAAAAPPTTRALAAEAVANAACAGADAWRRLPDPASAPPLPGLVDPRLDDPRLDDPGPGGPRPGNPALGAAALDDKVALCLDAERRALRLDPAITLVDEAVYAERRLDVAIHNSAGLRARYRATTCALYLVVKAGSGDAAASGVASTWARGPAGLDLDGLVARACRRAIVQQGGCRVPSRRMPVIFEAEAGADLLKMLAPALGGDAVRKGRSRLAGCAGAVVASPLVTVIDDLGFLGGPAAAPFDDEGVPAQCTALIEAGRLNGFLYNEYEARAAGRRSTGNGWRRTWRLQPELRPTNIFFAAGAGSADDLDRATGDGLHVLRVQGAHNANPVTGQFSVGASGYLVRDGRPAGAVRGVAVAGNLFDLLWDIDAVAGDLTFVPRLAEKRESCGSPTFRVRDLVVGGGDGR